MPNFETNFTSFEGGKHIEAPESKRERLEHFVSEYTCKKEDEPRWCIYGNSPDGTSDVLYWITPTEGDQFVAYKIVQLIDELGGLATAERTEWNEELKGNPVYKQEAV